MELTIKDLERAIIFATEKHNGQIRKGNNSPYILHPLSVMQHLYNYKKSKNIIMLAISTVLHDTVEDCDTSIEEIAKLFGYQVASIVLELTSDSKKIEEIGKAPYLLAKMLGMSSYALVIKLCDRLDNINDMVDMNENFRTKYIKETNFILDGLLDVNNGINLSKTHLRLIKDIRKSIKKY